jgi:hypothetical protein
MATVGHPPSNAESFSKKSFLASKWHQKIQSGMFFSKNLMPFDAIMMPFF